MTQTTRSEITGILLALHGDEAGRREYNNRLFEHIYNELHRVATDLMRLQRVDHTLQPTAVVHEAYLRLVDQTRTDWQDRAHFFRTAARAMRQILMNHERNRSAGKRGGGGQKVTLDDKLAVGTEKDVTVLELDAALTSLARLDERMAQVVELRIFAGMTVVEAAFVLGVSERTVHEDWRVAKIWLRRELPGGPSP